MPLRHAPKTGRPRFRTEDEVLEDFYERIRVAENGCWEWQGFIKENGYGQLKALGHVRVHRVAWFLFYGPIPVKTCVLHLCDNRRCARPSHLFLGTPADNTRDMIAKGRMSVGCSRKNTVLTPEIVRELRRLYTPNVVSLSMLARHFGLKITTVHAVIAKRSWKHIT